MDHGFVSAQQGSRLGFPTQQCNLLRAKGAHALNAKRAKLGPQQLDCRGAILPFDAAGPGCGHFRTIG
jgi:hypothetical protein